MFCTQCGNKLLPGASFCGVCGAKVSDKSKELMEKENAPAVIPVEVKEETPEICDDSVKEPVIEEPVVKEPVSEEPVEEAKAEEQAEEPVADEEPAAEEGPVAEEPETSEQVTEEPVAEEPVTEEPTPEETPIPETKEPEPMESSYNAPSIDAVSSAQKIYSQEYMEAPKKEKKKLSGLAVTCIVLSVLLVACIIGLVLLLNSISARNKEMSFTQEIAEDFVPAEPGLDNPEPAVPGAEPAPKDAVTGISHMYDDFINSTTFVEPEGLVNGDVIYVGKPVFEDVGSAYMVFVLSADKKSVKNVSIYISEIDKEITSNGTSYSLSGLSIRQDYNASYDLNGNDIEISIGKSELDIAFENEFQKAEGEFEFVMTYTPVSFSAYSSPASPVDIDFGESDITFVPVKVK